MHPTEGQRLFINRQHLNQAHVGPDPDAPAARALRPGEVRLAIERFALTANNITYAAFGDAMKYWQFFPSGHAELGCLPMWGYATVMESQAEGPTPGRRVWGYFPAGTHLVVTPGKVSGHGFTDSAPHRQDLALVYNQYSFCDADPGWKSELEGLQAVLRPLFTTAFLIDDFLDDQRFFGAQQVLLSSASSKTAIATAHSLSLRRGTPGAPAVIGLTSDAKLAFTRELGCYGHVISYDTLTTLSAEVPSVYVDFSGNAELRRQIHEHFSAQLNYSCSVGGTHWDALGSSRDLPGPKPTLFFAPAQVKLRSAPPPAGWGAAELQRRIGSAWAAFIAQVSGRGWVEIVERRGAPATLEAYQQMLAGQVDARWGLMLSLQS